MPDQKANQVFAIWVLFSQICCALDLDAKRGKSLDEIKWPKHINFSGKRWYQLAFEWYGWNFGIVLTQAINLVLAFDSKFGFVFKHESCWIKLNQESLWDTIWDPEKVPAVFQFFHIMILLLMGLPLLWQQRCSFLWKLIQLVKLFAFWVKTIHFEMTDIQENTFAAILWQANAILLLENQFS